MKGKRGQQILCAGLMLVLAATSAKAQGTWATRAPMPTGRYGLAVGVINGTLYAVGGYDANHNPVATLEAYDPVADSWTTKTPMPTARGALGAAVIAGVLYAIGGCTTQGCPDDLGDVGTVEAYDPSTDSWTTKAPMPTPRESFGVAAIGSVFYAVGGNCPSLQPYGPPSDTNCPYFGPYLADNQAYNPSSNSWSVEAPMPTPRREVAVATLNGLLYAAGSMTQTASGVFEAYDPVSNSWSAVSPLPIPEGSAGAASLNGLVYVVGGFADNSGSSTAVSNAMQMYNPNTNNWTAQASMPTPRGSLGVAAVNGMIIAVGGLQSCAAPSPCVLQTTEAFTTVLNVPIEIKPPASAPVPINLSSAGVIPVAILSTTTFDATQVDPATVTLAGAEVQLIGKSGKYQCSVQDANGDGIDDLMCQISTAQFMIETGSSNAVLEGQTFSGQAIQGQETISIVPQ
jgi:N-acetylneuraminic acid mutarotase